jgi:hypothetical protein
MHGTEAPKIHGTGEAQLGSGCLDVAQLRLPKGPALTRTEHQIIRLPVLARFPPSDQGALHQPALIERHLPLASVGFHVVEFAFVDAFFNGGAVCLARLPL